MCTEKLTDRETDRQTEGQTDMTKVIIAFRNFANARKSKGLLTAIM